MAGGDEKTVEQAFVLKTEVESAVEIEPTSLRCTEDPDLGSRYEVLELLGQGGMGSVYKVFDKELNSILAAKIIRSELAEDSHAVKRFEQEIKAASQLNHENLVTVYGHGRSSLNLPYLLMDYIEGSSLADLLKTEGPLSYERAINIFNQTCAALGYAHKKNVIHRDLKPSNLMIKKTDSGHEEVRVLDFGIAKILPSEGSDFGRTNLTQTGDVFGSPLYMSPEQCQNNPQDARSDIYAFGCVMYEVLTGIQPFYDDNPVKIILRHMNYEPPLVSEKCKEKTRAAAFDAVVQKCLEKSPEARYQNIGELAKDLVAVASGKPTAAKVRKQGQTKQPMTSMGKFLIAAVLALTTCASLVVFSEGTRLSKGTVVRPASDSFTDATDLDAKSYAYFLKGEYEKAAPLLEFGIATYRERVEADRKGNDPEQLVKDEVLLTENVQHVGKCYLEVAKLAESAGDNAKARTYFNKALERYREAMQFWMRSNHKNLRGTMASEAVGEYELVLKKLNLVDELAKLNTWKAIVTL